MFHQSDNTISKQSTRCYQFSHMLYILSYIILDLTKCKTSAWGGEYIGHVDMTVNNLTCQLWIGSVSMEDRICFIDSLTPARYDYNFNSLRPSDAHMRQ